MVHENEPRKPAPRALGDNKWGIYLHIPFCSRICSYCDFSKTARYDTHQVDQYFSMIGQQLRSWFQWLQQEHGKIPRFESVFFGGGTPGLFGTEYAPILAEMSDHLTADAEISIEVNPENVTDENCRVWRRLGFNRISMGVQTFEVSGLLGMGRSHSPSDALRAIDIIRRHFSNHNIDLIYGWQGQSMPQWESDLMAATAAGVPHLSLYNLIFESGTPLGKRASRTGEAFHPDERLDEMYQLACEALGRSGYEHEEVSNWSKPGFSCAHNWLYWHNDTYIGVGAGAHGHVIDGNGVHWRSSYTKNWRRFLRNAKDLNASRPDNWSPEVGQFEQQQTHEVLIDTIATGLRTKDGVSNRQLELLSGRQIQPTPAIQLALTNGKVMMAEERIRLNRAEWFREQYWAVELLRSFDP